MPQPKISGIERRKEDYLKGRRQIITDDGYVAEGDNNDFEQSEKIENVTLNAYHTLYYLDIENPINDNIYHKLTRNANLLQLMNNYAGFLDIPTGSSKLRSVFSDFNKVLIEEQRRKNMIQTIVTSTSEICKNTKTGRRNLKINLHNAYDNMCFYCGRTCKGFPVQCDHVIPIIQMFISVRRNSELVYNFERVHTECNQKASNLSIGEVWERIGTNYFPGPAKAPYAKLNIIDTATSSQPQILDLETQDRIPWCKGYLGYHIINKLDFLPLEIQQDRKRALQDLIQKYEEYVRQGLIYLGDDERDVMDALLNLSEQSSGFQFMTQFGKYKKSINKTTKKQKYSEKVIKLSKKYNIKLDKNVVKNLKKLLSLQKKAKKFKLTITKKNSKGKRVYKTINELTKEIIKSKSKSKSKSTKKKVTKQIIAVREKAKKLKIKLTKRTSTGKRLYKTNNELMKEIKRKTK